MPERLYFVWGGIFADPEFRTLEPGTEECHGPFHDEAEANRAWSEAMRRNIDIAQHRLFVLGLSRPQGGPTPAKQDWLVCHDYGAGGLWAVIRSPTQAVITERYRDLTVYARRPRFIDDDEYARLLVTDHFDVDGPVSGWLQQLATTPSHSESA